MADEFLDSLIQASSSQNYMQEILAKEDTARVRDKILNQQALINLANQIDPPPHLNNSPEDSLKFDFTTDLESVDWNASILETLAGQFTDTEQMFDYFNTNADFTSASFNTFNNHSDNQGWKWFTHNIGEKRRDVYMFNPDPKNEVIGSSYQNFLSTNSPRSVSEEEVEQQYGNRNAYFFLNSSYAPNAITKHASSPIGSSAAQYGNIVSNMYRYNMEESLDLITPKGDGVQPDIANPFANSGDGAAYDFWTVEDTNSGGPAYYSQTPSIWLMGYIHSKYGELQDLITANGGFNAKLEDGSIAKIPTPETWVSLGTHSYSPGSTVEQVKEIWDTQERSGWNPINWITFGQAWSYLTDSEFNEMRNLDANVEILSKTIRDNGYMVQGDFVSKFGKAHELLNIWQGEEQFLFPNTIGGVPINGKSFYSEESKAVPGFALTYTSGSSLFAIGTKYDPFSKDIRNARFGPGYPFQNEIMVERGTDVIEGKFSQLSGYSPSKVNENNHFTLAHNLVSTHFDPDGYRVNVGGGGELAYHNTGMDEYNGSLAVLGWDSNHREATLTMQNNRDTKNIYSGGKSIHWDFGKFYMNKVKGVHGGDNNLPTFNGFLINQGYDDHDLEISNAAAKDKAKENWMHHTKWGLENVDLYGVDPIVTQLIDQLVEAHTIIALKNEDAHKKAGLVNSKIPKADFTGAGSKDIEKFFPKY